MTPTELAARTPRPAHRRLWREGPPVEVRGPKSMGSPLVQAFRQFVAPTLALVVSTSVESTENGWQWHVSVSAWPGGRKTRPRDDQMAAVREAFDMTLAEEDNSGGRDPLVRHLWLLVPATPREAAP